MFNFCLVLSRFKTQYKNKMENYNMVEGVDLTKHLGNPIVLGPILFQVGASLWLYDIFISLWLYDIFMDTSL